MGARPSSFTPDPELAPVVMPAVVVESSERTWSDQQQAIFEWFEHMPGRCDLAPHNENLVVRARAGTGKTTTIVEGVNRAPEEAILLCAFNKNIQEELASRLTNGSAEAKTLHSLGYQCIRRQWPRMPVSKGSARADQLTKAGIGNDPRVPRQVFRLISNLHTKVRDMGLENDYETVERAAIMFNLEPADWDQYDLNYVVSSAISAVSHARSTPPNHAIGIDFADMIYLPLAWELVVPLYNLVVVDEAQDMTMAQLSIAQGLLIEGGRMCIVGDDKQAIYGFRGADSGSLDRLKKELNAGELPLLTTYRCGQVIVREAQKLVPDIYAGESNPEGIVDEVSHQMLLEDVQPGDFVLSRINAPLVSITLSLIRAGKRARMAGRDIGAGLQAVIRGFKLADFAPVDMLLERVDSWESKTCLQLANSGKLDLVDRCHDQAATIRALAEGDYETVGAVLQAMQWLFEDEKTMDRKATIVCSSVHKAKGLEAEHVFVLVESLYRGKDAAEETNIHYVAVTRAKSHLSLVKGVPNLGRKPKW